MSKKRTREREKKNRRWKKRNKKALNIKRKTIMMIINKTEFWKRESKKINNKEKRRGKRKIKREQNYFFKDRRKY